MCHCLACQRRTGSAFGIQARWPKDLVDVTGRYIEYVRISDAGEERTFRFCPDCGATVFWTTTTEGWTDTIAVPIGAFADPSFPQPTVSVYGRDGIRGCPSRTGSKTSTASPDLRGHSRTLAHRIPISSTPAAIATIPNRIAIALTDL
jgi:hypothetical protein